MDVDYYEYDFQRDQDEDARDEGGNSSIKEEEQDKKGKKKKGKKNKKKKNKKNKKGNRAEVSQVFLASSYGSCV